ncbi:BF3164 family lipoprotein [Pedobacter hiemivivus]|uniref:TolB-like 6-blade propeller-like n=1 Tax=Pedobacter hiemivivus TaxID=2530454 RepID=A0A4R0N8T9_9SPHI|nr:BF3164 family lipoprotein [Pedobacter hiemivivus]TCC96561.1 hypothetical protein EZ444_11335 [Pedobacter hiemivivus]
MLKYLILISIFFVSCSNSKNEQNKDTTIFSKFPTTEAIVFKNFIKYENGAISRMYLRDTSLIVYDWRGKGGYFFYQYGLNSGSVIRKYIPQGRGKGAALGSLSAGLYKNELWMYDISLSKIIFSAIETKSFTADTSAAYREFAFSRDYYNIQFLDDSTVIANGNYQTPKKLQELNFYSGKILADYGILEGVPKDIPFYAWKRYNEAFMELKSTNDKVVLAHRLSDQIEVFDLKSHKSITVKGPENYKAEFLPMQSHDGKDLITHNEKSRYSFTQVMSTDKFIYVLHSGNNISGQNIDYAKSIFVYDWYGKPIKRVNLDRYVTGFTISDDDKSLYAYDVISKYIVTAKI